MCFLFYGFLSLAKIIGKNLGENINENLSGKYKQKLLKTKKSAIDAIKTSSKRVIQKTSEFTGDLIGNKTAIRFTRVQKLYNKIIQRQLPMRMIKKYLKKYIYISRKNKKLLMI